MIKLNGLGPNIDKRVQTASKFDTKTNVHLENFEDKEIFINSNGSHKLGLKETIDTSSLL